MRRGTVVLAVALVAAPAVAQQPPATPELPAAYKGGPIDAAIARHDWAEAEQLLVAAIEAAPESPGLLQVLGSVFLIERKPLNAAIALKKAEAMTPLDEGARYTLALAYLSLHHNDWARPELERLHTSHPSNPTYEYWLGRTDYDAGQYASAVTRFEHVVTLDPQFVRGYDNLGLAYEALNQPDQALAAYRKAVAINRTAATRSAWPALNLGIMLKNRGDLGEAEALLREAALDDPSMAQAHYQLGTLLEQQDHLDEAVAELKRAATCDPAYAEPYYALARIYRRRGQAADAADALAAFERLHAAKREQGQ
jgi:tetratricopeptide (TPR) repeat protein